MAMEWEGCGRDRSLFDGFFLRCNYDFLSSFISLYKRLDLVEAQNETDLDLR